MAEPRRGGGELSHRENPPDFITLYRWITLAALLLLLSCGQPEKLVIDPPRQMRSISTRCYLFASYRDAKEQKNPIQLLKPDESCAMTVLYPSHEWIFFDICQVRLKGAKQPFYTYAQFLAIPVDRASFTSTLGPDGDLIIGKERVDNGHPIPMNYQPNDLIDADAHVKALGFHMVAPGRRDKNVRLRSKALEAFEKMFKAARREGIELTIVSGFRSAEEQEKIFSKITMKVPKQRTVAMPGFSEHQLGTTADISSPEVGNHLIRDFETSRAGTWVRNNCKRFGLRITYSRKRARTLGFTIEPWHLRYMGSKP